MQPFKEMSYVCIKKRGENLKTALCKKAVNRIRVIEQHRIKTDTFIERHYIKDNSGLCVHRSMC